jgi:hypothetical protein
MVLCHFGGDGVCLGGLLPKDLSGRAETVLKEQQFLAPSKLFHSFSTEKWLLPLVELLLRRQSQSRSHRGALSNGELTIILSVLYVVSNIIASPTVPV